MGEQREADGCVRFRRASASAAEVGQDSPAGKRPNLALACLPAFSGKTKHTMSEQENAPLARAAGPSVDESPVGLTWTVREPISRTSHALVDAGRVWLIDPTWDPTVLERVAAFGEPVAVIQLLDRHNRDCATIAARLGVPHLSVPASLPDTPFRVIPVVDIRFWREVALWWPARRTLVVAEAVGTARAYAPGPTGAGVSIGLRLWPPRALAAYAPEHLLVGHGPALHEPQAAVALTEAMERSRRDLPRALTELLKMLRGTAGDRG